MTEALWLAGLLAANLWSAGSGIPVVDAPDGGLPPFPVAVQADAAPPAPPSIPADPCRGADAPRTSPSLAQVQFDVTIAEIDRAAIPDATYRWMRKQLGFASENAPFSVLNGSNECGELLRALRTDKLANILAEPRIQTLSGRPASFASGGVTTREGRVTSTRFGTLINLLPIVKDNGKIMLEVHVELSKPSAANAAGLPRFDIRSVRATAVMEAGRTLALVGLVAPNADGKERELVVLVTPTLLAGGESAKPPVAVQMSAHVSRKIYLIVDDGNGQKVLVLPTKDAQTVLDVLADASASMPIAAANRVWVARPMPHGQDGVLFLPVEWHRILQAGETKTNYLLQSGDRIYVETRGLRQPGSDAVQAAYGSLPAKVVQVQAVSAKGASLPTTTADVVALSVADVIALAKAGVSNAIILRQMDAVKALADVPAHQVIFRKQAAKQQGVIFLTADDLIHLKQQGVSDELVGALQERFMEAMRPANSTSPARPGYLKPD